MSGKPKSVSKPRGSKARKRTSHRAAGGTGALYIYGRHAVEAALANPARTCRRLVASANALEKLDAGLRARAGAVEPVKPETLEALVGEEARHQGLVLEAAPLPAPALAEAAAPLPGARNLVVVLDQVTDPHNVGAILRSAAAFGARALITQDRHSPPESGALAKAASGALDMVPWVRVVNLGRALEELAGLGYWRLGLAGEAEATLAATDLGDNLALVLGAEGRGLREGTCKHVDALARIPISGGAKIDSLNVSNAAAVALYEFSRGA